MRPCLEIVRMVVVGYDDGKRRQTRGVVSEWEYSRGHEARRKSAPRRETAIGEHGRDRQAIDDLLFKHERDAIFDRHPGDGE